MPPLPWPGLGVVLLLVSNMPAVRGHGEDGMSKCGECEGSGRVSTTIGNTLWGDSVDREIAGVPRNTPVKVPCSTCSGSGKVTDPKPTTNKQIARQLGWRQETHPTRGKRWRDPDGYWCNPLPDFEHDWAHAGPLWQEMVNDLGWKKVCFLLWVQFPDCWDADNAELSLKITIARAWLAWKKEEAE